MAKSPGRPPEFTQDIADLICQRLMEGKGLKNICAAADMPNRNTVYRWMADARYAAFHEAYARARLVQADAYFDECIEIADGCAEETAAIQKARLRIDTRKWAAARLRPDTYGDKVAVAGDPENPLVVAAPGIEEVARRIAFTLASAPKE